jgi:hypothetical protein
MQELSLDVQNQSRRQIRASAVSGVNRLWKSEITLRPVLKVDSDATVEARTAKADTYLNLISTNLGIKVIFSSYWRL